MDTEETHKSYPPCPLRADDVELYAQIGKAMVRVVATMRRPSCMTLKDWREAIADMLHCNMSIAYAEGHDDPANDGFDLYWKQFKKSLEAIGGGK